MTVMEELMRKYVKEMTTPKPVGNIFVGFFPINLLQLIDCDIY